MEFVQNWSFARVMFTFRGSLSCEWACVVFMLWTSSPKAVLRNWMRLLIAINKALERHRRYLRYRWLMRKCINGSSSREVCSNDRSSVHAHIFVWVLLSVEIIDIIILKVGNTFWGPSEEILLIRNNFAFLTFAITWIFALWRCIFFYATNKKNYQKRTLKVVKVR